MATTTVTTCDGCSETWDETSVGRKIVIGCEGPFPPSVFFNYHSRCEVPPMAELAKMRPYVLFQSVEIRTSDEEWVKIWSGELMFDPRTNIFTNGYERIIEETDISPINQ